MVSRLVFGMEPHQIRYMLATFRSASIAEAFLLSLSEVSLWRRRLGIPPMRRGRAARSGPAAPTTRYFG